MLAYIRFKTLAGADIITGIGTVSFMPEDGEVLVYPHADANSAAFYRLESSITMDDVQSAIDRSLRSAGVITVKGTKVATPEENKETHGTD